MEKYTFSDWKKKYRPDGVGRSYITRIYPDRPPETDLVCEFTEVICDFCNEEIFPTDADGNESIIWADDSHAICCACNQER